MVDHGDGLPVNRIVTLGRHLVGCRRREVIDQLEAGVEQVLGSVNLAHGAQPPGQLRERIDSGGWRRNVERIEPRHLLADGRRSLGLLRPDVLRGRRRRLVVPRNLARRESFRLPLR